MPALLAAAAQSRDPMLALSRLLALVGNVLRRTAYLALLDEQPEALARLVDVVAHSALLAERLAAHPLLLDELLDARVAGALPSRESIERACLQAVEGDDDVEHALRTLNEVRQALGFRIAMALRDAREPAADAARQLAWLADAVIARVVSIAQDDMLRLHGRIDGARFAVLGYGSLGGEELGFGLHFGNADARAHVRGLHKERIGERFFDLFLDGFRVGLERATGHDDPIGHP